MRLVRSHFYRGGSWKVFEVGVKRLKSGKVG